MLSISHSIYADFDQIPSVEVRVILDIPEAFDKVWHKGLLCKIETSVGISGNLHQLFQSFINDKLQRLVLNGHSSNWSPSLAGVSIALLGIHK